MIHPTRTQQLGLLFALGALVVLTLVRVMTDRYAVSLYEQLFIPKSWVGGGEER